MEELPFVQHWMLCRRAIAGPGVGAYNPYTLQRVRYRFHLKDPLAPSPARPKRLPLVTMFARFFGGDGPVNFEIGLFWHPDNDIDDDPLPLESYGPFTVFFRSGEKVRDFSFRLRNVPICGPGVYEIRLIPIGEFEELDPIAWEYFEVSP